MAVSAPIAAEALLCAYKCGIKTIDLFLYPIVLPCDVHFDKCHVHFPSVGVKKGDRVSIYLPMILELVIAMLACARIGALHSVVVGTSSLCCPWW